MAKLNKSDNIHAQILEESGQSPATRAHLFLEIEKLIGRPLVSFFTSFHFPVSIDDGDADIIQSMLSQLDLTNGLALLINSPGGDGLAAERIINVCRSYSGTNEYWTIVMGKSKSAATMVCLGSSKIMMAPPSELGPVDPQIIRTEDGEKKHFSAYSLVSTYDKLFRGATQSKGNLEPYIQQLAHFDAREIATFRSMIDLSDDIALKTLGSGMMAGASKKDIKKKIKMFLDPAAGTMSHGRPIYEDEAKSAGLNIADIDVRSPLWKLLYELYVRTDRYVSADAAKAVESKIEAFQVPVRR